MFAPVQPGAAFKKDTWKGIGKMSGSAFKKDTWKGIGDMSGSAFKKDRASLFVGQDPPA